jgi:hypothetical protein
MQSETHFTFDRPECHIAARILDYLSRYQKSSGALWDPIMLSELPHQYSHSSYAFGQVALYCVDQDPARLNRAASAMQYIIGLPDDLRNQSREWHNLSMLLSALVLRNLHRPTTETEALLELLKAEIATLRHGVSFHSLNKGNNYLATRALNHWLRYEFLKTDLDKDEAIQYINYVLGWQYKDGIIYDHPKQPGCSNGVPQLAYHVFMTAKLLLFGRLSKNERCLRAAYRGLMSFLPLVAPDGEAFYYGRNNTLFAYSGLVLLLRQAIDQWPLEAVSYLPVLESVIKHLATCAEEDGHLRLVPNILERQRSGLDSYAYLTVFNAFAAQMFLISSILIPHESVQASELHPGIDAVCEGAKRVLLLPDSGFFMAMSEELRVSLNLKGHYLTKRYLGDPRLVPLVPLILKVGRKDLLPSIPTPQYNRIQEQKSLFGSILSNYKSLKRFHWMHPRFAGFHPYIWDGASRWIPGPVEASSTITIGKTHLILAIGRFVRLWERGNRALTYWLLEALSSRFPGRWTNRLDRINLIVRSSSASYLRAIVIHPDGLVFVDRFLNVNQDLPSNAVLVPFSVRVYADWEIQSYVNLTWFKGPHACFGVWLQGDLPLSHRQTGLGSAKGEVTLYEAPPLPMDQVQGEARDHMALVITSGDSAAEVTAAMQRLRRNWDELAVRWNAWTAEQERKNGECHGE